MAHPAYGIEVSLALEQLFELLLLLLAQPWLSPASLALAAD